jgi:hypothetical protein
LKRKREKGKVHIIKILLIIESDWWTYTGPFLTLICVL